MANCPAPVPVPAPPSKPSPRVFIDPLFDQNRHNTSIASSRGGQRTSRAHQRKKAVSRMGGQRPTLSPSIKRRLKLPLQRVDPHQQHHALNNTTLPEMGNGQGPLLHNYDWRKNMNVRNAGWAGSKRRTSVESHERPLAARQGAPQFHSQPRGGGQQQLYQQNLKEYFQAPPGHLLYRALQEEAVQQAYFTEGNNKTIPEEGPS